MPGTAAVMRCSATMELMFDVRMAMAFWGGVGCLHWGYVCQNVCIIRGKNDVQDDDGR
jgi:hypothetical protein